MATVVLIRHGRTTANSSGVLAGRASGVHLDDAGKKQAERAATRLSGVPLAALVTSPLVRCRETAQAIAAAQPRPLALAQDRGLIECDYGEWSGQKLAALAKLPLWKIVQTQPAAAVFPDGEGLLHMQSRVVEAVRGRDRQVSAAHGPDAVWAAVSHGDLIKALLADALGLHLDQFQRIHVDPASISIVRFHDNRPQILGVNTHEGALDWLNPPKRRRGRSADAAVGGGAGPEPR
ncbi:MAG: MSMEG_4193 family putative phosphomutase [Nocardioides sp.]|jgi:probable phosphomutase (TIGR03848 family)